MKILVTGAKGFVGGYIVEKLLENNFQVIGLDIIIPWVKLKIESNEI